MNFPTGAPPGLAWKALYQVPENGKSGMLDNFGLINHMSSWPIGTPINHALASIQKDEAERLMMRKSNLPDFKIEAVYSSLADMTSYCVRLPIDWNSNDPVHGYDMDRIPENIDCWEHIGSKEAPILTGAHGKSYALAQHLEPHLRKEQLDAIEPCLVDLRTIR